MARPKEYTNTTVLNRAMNLFWKKGFASTSMNDLVITTGLNRHSMYSDYGNKEGLFCSSLEEYGQIMRKKLFSILSKNRGFEAIQMFFMVLVGFINQMPVFNGCMMVTAASEKNSVPPDAFEKSQKYFEELESLFGKCLEEALVAKMIKKKTDIPSTSKYLVCMFQGMNIFSITNENKNARELMVTLIMENLKRI
jgi:TetR/AcrR family transcriptional regulator, transcriptional repressor for nem operon